MHSVTASVSSLSTAATDTSVPVYILAMMSMGPALIGEETDDSSDLTPMHMFHHIADYWGRCVQFP